MDNKLDEQQSLPYISIQETQKNSVKKDRV